MPNLDPVDCKTVLEAGGVDVGIITVRSDEAGAILSRINFDTLALGKIRSFNVGRLLCDNGELITVSHCSCLGQGFREAAATTEELISDLAPRFIILVGIAGGVPNDDFCLGDVAVTQRVYDTQVSAAKPGGKREFSIETRPLHAKVRDLVAQLAFILPSMASWSSKGSVTVARPQVSLEDLQVNGAPNWQRRTVDAVDLHFRAGGARQAEPLACAASFASGSELVQDPEVVQQWLPSHRDIKAIEMEMTGVLFACQRPDGSEVPAMSIRGISDVVGLRREQTWTHYACQTSASFTIALLRTGSLTLSLKRPLTLFNVRNQHRDRNLSALLSLGSERIEPKSASGSPIAPSELFVSLAAGRSRKATVGVNFRPTARLGLVQLAYLQQMTRMVSFGFRPCIVLYDLCTTAEHNPNEINAYCVAMERNVARFSGLAKRHVQRLSRLIEDKSSVSVVDQLFRLGRPALGYKNPSANDPATSLDNLLSLAVEDWVKYDILLSGGQDANDFWAR